MALGTYRLQDPNGKELQALVHGNRLLKAHINTRETLRKLWASPAAKDALRRQNGRPVELVDSDARGTEQLDRLLLGKNTLESTISQTPIVDEIPEPEPEPASTEVQENTAEAFQPSSTTMQVQEHTAEAFQPSPKRKRKQPLTPQRKSSRTRRPVARYEM
jgi:hypothetical protein